MYNLPRSPVAKHQEKRYGKKIEIKLNDLFCFGEDALKSF